MPNPSTLAILMMTDPAKLERQYPRKRLVDIAAELDRKYDGDPRCIEDHCTRLLGFDRKRMMHGASLRGV